MSGAHVTEEAVGELLDLAQLTVELARKAGADNAEVYVGAGTLDVGITGRDLLRDSGAKAEEIMGLWFGRSRFRFAGPQGVFTDLSQLAGQRIATSYVGVVRSFLEEGPGKATYQGR